MTKVIVAKKPKYKKIQNCIMGVATGVMTTLYSSANLVYAGGTQQSTGGTGGTAGGTKTGVANIGLRWICDTIL